MTKKGEMGIGTLIVFIALLLIAVSVSGLLLRVAGEVQEKELTTAKKASAQVSTNVRIIEVSATDGIDSAINNFSIIMKLAPGSEDIKLKDALLILSANDGTATLSYGGRNASLENEVEGYYSITSQGVEDIEREGPPFEEQTPLAHDYDLDNMIDYLVGGLDGDYAYLLLSTTGAQVRLGHCDGTGVFITELENSIYAYRDQGDPYSCEDVTDLASITLYRNQSASDLGKGFYSVETIQSGINPIPGTMQRGDVLRVRFQAPCDIGEDETVTIRFIPKFGTPTITQFRTPEGIEEERVYLFP